MDETNWNVVIEYESMACPMICFKEDEVQICGILLYKKGYCGDRACNFANCPNKKVV